jgi:heme A synthase
LIALVVGVWGLISYFRRVPASGGYRSTLVMTEVLFILQGVLGILLFLGGQHPRDGLHTLYGVLLVIALPIAATYTSGRDPRNEPLIYGIVGLFMVGLTIRGIGTA